MVEKKSILIWVSEDEKEALLRTKKEQTWREFFLDLARISYEPILMGRPRIKGSIEKIKEKK